MKRVLSWHLVFVATLALALLAHCGGRPPSETSWGKHTGALPPSDLVVEVKVDSPTLPAMETYDVAPGEIVTCTNKKVRMSVAHENVVVFGEILPNLRPGLIVQVKI